MAGIMHEYKLCAQMPSYFFPMIVDSVIVDSKYHNIENKKERKREKNVGG